MVAPLQSLPHFVPPSGTQPVGQSPQRERDNETLSSRPPPPVARVTLDGDALQRRLRTLGRSTATGPDDDQRGRGAVNAYLAVDLAQERQQLSDLLGVDEYA